MKQREPEERAGGEGGLDATNRVGSAGATFGSGSQRRSAACRGRVSKTAAWGVKVQLGSKGAGSQLLAWGQRPAWPCQQGAAAWLGFPRYPAGGSSLPCSASRGQWCPRLRQQRAVAVPNDLVQIQQLHLARRVLHAAGGRGNGQREKRAECETEEEGMSSCTLAAGQGEVSRASDERNADGVGTHACSGSPSMEPGVSWHALPVCLHIAAACPQVSRHSKAATTSQSPHSLRLARVQVDGHELDEVPAGRKENQQMSGPVYAHCLEQENRKSSQCLRPFMHTVWRRSAAGRRAGAGIIHRNRFGAQHKSRQGSSDSPLAVVGPEQLRLPPL